MTLRAVLVSILLSGFAAGAWAQTPAPKPPQAAPKPALPTVTPAPTTQLQSEFAVAVGDTVLFTYQSKELTLRSLKILDNQAKWLKAKPEVKITLEAYCDDDIDPKEAQAFCLSRAREVRDYLVRQGVTSERISLVAFDDSQAPRRATKPDSGKPDPKKADSKTSPDSKKGKKDEKARRTNRRVATRVSV